jgi:hypothetical protein
VDSEYAAGNGPPLLSILCIELRMEHRQDDPMHDVAMALRPASLAALFRRVSIACLDIGIAIAKV